ncbi:MAG: hypothetical protein KBS66_04775 [Eubacterium sp.]|nr:hypothetical protein [Candidatus Colimonas fimequi]
MFKVLRHIVRILALVAIIITIGPMSALQADAGSVINIDTKTSVNVGDTFTVTVSFKGNDVGRVDGQMTYDSSVVSYISGGSSKGDSGYVQLSDAGTGEPIKFNLKFKAVGPGSSKMAVSTNGIYNFDEEFIDAPASSKSVTVNGEAEETTEATEETEAIEETDVTVVTDPVVPEEEEDSFLNVLGNPLYMIFALAAGVILIMLIVMILVSKNNKKGKHSKRRR